jgi:hypothetical protein
MSESKNSKNTFEDLYLEQKKKSSILMTLVVVLAITTIAGLGWGFSSSSGSQKPPSGFQGLNGQGAPGGGMGQMDFERFFKDDGSVDTQAVQDMVDRLPSSAGSGFLDRFKTDINQAATDGKITLSQADALVKAFESAGSTSDAN